jgi:hypothetical protein
MMRSLTTRRHTDADALVRLGPVGRIKMKRNNTGMNKRSEKQSNNEVMTAIGWASLVVAIEVITEFTGIRKYKLNPEPKTFMEVTRSWPIFLISGVATFLVVYYWRSSKRKQKKGQS